MSRTPRLVPVPAPKQYIILSVWVEIAIRFILYDHIKDNRKPTKNEGITKELAIKAVLQLTRKI